MARGIQECDGATVDIYLISADGLGNAACLAGSNVGFPYIVEKAGLTVVNVTHNNHNGGTALQLVLGIHMVVNQALLGGNNDFLLHLAAHFFCDNGSGFIVDDLGNGSHDAVFNQAANYLGAGLLHPGSQLANADLVGNGNLNRSLLGDLQLEPTHLLLLFVAALVAKVAALLVVLVSNANLLAGVLLGLFGHQLLHAVIKPVSIDGNAAGVNYPALLLPLGRLGALGVVICIVIIVILRLGILGLLGTALAAGLPRLLIVLTALGPLIARRLILLGLLGLCLCLGLLLLGRGIVYHQEIRVILSLLHPGSKHLFDGINLIFLGNQVENQVQLIVREHLCAGFGRFKMLRHHIHYALGGHVKILCHFSNLIFHETAHRATSKY